MRTTKTYKNTITHCVFTRYITKTLEGYDIAMELP